MRGKLVLERMAFPAARACVRVRGTPAAHQVVVGQGARPHDGGARVVVFRVLERGGSSVDERVHQPRRNVVGCGHGAYAAEVTLADVRDHVGHAGGRLVGRQREGERGVEQGEFRAEQPRGGAELAVFRIVADNARSRGLRPRGGNGEHARDGQAGRNGLLLREEIPGVAVVFHAEGDGFGGVDDRAATHGQKPVDRFGTCGGHGVAYPADFGVGPHAALLHVRDAGFVERSLHGVEQPRAHDRPLAVRDHDAGDAERAQLGPRLGCRAAPEHELGGRAKHEIVHKRPFTRMSWQKSTLSPAGNSSARRAVFGGRPPEKRFDRRLLPK